MICSREVPLPLKSGVTVEVEPTTVDPGRPDIGVLRLVFHSRRVFLLVPLHLWCLTLFRDSLREVGTKWRSERGEP